MDVLGGVRRRRTRLLAGARGDVLEIGVGTGRNLDLYPEGVALIGIDVSEGMLARARARAARLGRPGVLLRIADAQDLPFGDGTFDTVVATCVFCSVDDPVRGLREAARVVKPTGRVLLLEHVRPRNPIAARVFEGLDPLLHRALGFHVTRDVEANVRSAGLRVEQVRRGGIWREIHATATADELWTKLSTDPASTSQRHPPVGPGQNSRGASQGSP